MNPAPGAAPTVGGPVPLSPGDLRDRYRAGFLGEPFTIGLANRNTAQVLRSLPPGPVECKHVSATPQCVRATAGTQS